MLRHELNRRGHFLLRNDGLTALCKAGIEAMADIEACFNESGVNFTEGALRQAFKDERGCLRIVSLNNTNPKLLASLCKIMVSRRLASRSDNGLGINMASPAGLAWFRGEDWDPQDSRALPWCDDNCKLKCEGGRKDQVGSPL